MKGAQALTWRTLRRSASAPYKRSGRFAWYFARGKLRWDPVFSHLVAHGLVAPGARVLDIGCGQGLLASVLHAAGLTAHAGRWPRDWADAPTGARVTGIELMPRDVARAQAALGDVATFVCGDIRSAPFPAADVVVLLDVLHYLSHADQDAVLARARAALSAGGRIVMRVGDAASRRGFGSSQWVDRIVNAVRGHPERPRQGRSLAEWTAHLELLGFTTSSLPMHAGTPFANILLVGSLPR